PLLTGVLDLVGHGLDGGDADGPLLARFQQTGDQLLPLESLPRPVFLDHHVRDLVDPLVAGETAPAAEALPPPADDLALFALSRVDDLIAEMGAERALHLSQTALSRGPRRRGPSGARR